MSEIFTFALPDYEVERQKQAKQSVKQLVKEFTAQYTIALRSATLGKQTTGGQLINFKKAAQICEKYGQPIPDDLKCLIALYSHAEAAHIHQALCEEQNPLVRYPRPYREMVYLGGKKKVKR